MLPKDIEHWREAVERTLRRSQAESVQTFIISSEGVTRPDVPGSGELESKVAGMRRLVGRIARYESRFRADGILGENDFIHTVEAWDYGRAACMARWGLATRFCTLEEAEREVIGAGRSARETYNSWKEFSAAYILGRCLHFDDESFGNWYQDSLSAHTVLTTDPASPWLNIPW